MLSFIRMALERPQTLGVLALLILIVVTLAALFEPSTAVNELVQVAPLSIEYSTVAPLSTPLSVSAPFLVTRSLLSAVAEVSCVSATPGADGFVVSSVKLSELAADVLPATSI